MKYGICESGSGRHGNKNKLDKSENLWTRNMNIKHGKILLRLYIL
jgi:hypothetical protein